MCTTVTMTATAKHSVVVWPFRVLFESVRVLRAKQSQNALSNWVAFNCRIDQKAAAETRRLNGIECMWKRDRRKRVRKIEWKNCCWRTKLKRMANWNETNGKNKFVWCEEKWSDRTFVDKCQSRIFFLIFFLRFSSSLAISRSASIHFDCRGIQNHERRKIITDAAMNEADDRKCIFPWLRYNWVHAIGVDFHLNAWDVKEEKYFDEEWKKLRETQGGTKRKNILRRVCYSAVKTKMATNSIETLSTDDGDYLLFVPINSVTWIENEWKRSRSRVTHLASVDLNKQINS